MIFFGKPVSTFPDHALVKFFSVAGITKAAGLFKEGLLGLASGGAELLPIFRISSESLDRRQLSDTPFHRTPDTHCRQEVRSLYNARREQAAYRSFKPQSCGRFSSIAADASRQLSGRSHAVGATVRPCSFKTTLRSELCTSRWPL
jgi:hypothetical protein